MKIRSHCFSLVLALIVTTISGPIRSAHAADEYVVATVDVSRVINSADEAKKAKADLDEQTKKAKKLVEEKQAALKPLQDKAEKGEIKPGTKEGEEIKTKTRELVELMRDKEDEIKKSFMTLNTKLAEKTLKIVSAYAKEKNISLVLDRSESNRSAVLYGEKSFDITDEIINRFNK